MLLNGDSQQHLKEIQDNSIDLILTDPPYGISFMGKDWDKALPSVEIWKECFRVLKEGKLCFVMCSPRQDVLSRMIINLEDAGFRTNYTSIYWTYASGFPKAANVSKLIDKKAGAKRTEGDIIKDRWNGYGNIYQRTISKNQGMVLDNSKPATDEAKKMEGAYVGFQPKPAVEIIIVTSKGKTLTWLDDCRIPYQSEDDQQTAKVRFPIGQRNERFNPQYGWHQNNMINLPFEPSEKKGRFPANLLVSDDVLNDGLFRKGSPGTRKARANTRNTYGEYGPVGELTYGYNDSGSYSRYFSLDAWSKTFPFLIVPKASKSEKNKGLDNREPIKVNDGRQTPIDNPFQRGETLRTNTHPTVKPVKLFSYLITMGSREGDIVLDPFCGSGTTCIAAEQLNRKWIGIEINPQYIEIAKARLKPYLVQQKLG